MHLLQFQEDGELSLAEFYDDNIPPYAILSHTWGKDEEEVTFKDVSKGRGKSKAGYAKIQFCRRQAAKDKLEYFWVDTCCINKKDFTQLSEAINSMFRWYQNSAKCYAYLSDVSVSKSLEGPEPTKDWGSLFKNSRWFTRGWTLQELVAPKSIEFFSREQHLLGNKLSLETTIHEITGIAVEVLQGGPLSKVDVHNRMSWAARRHTKREEDAAYCLLGIFDIHMPLIYGEGRAKAMERLHEEIQRSSKNKSSVVSSSSLFLNQPNRWPRQSSIRSLDDEQRLKLKESLRFDQMESRQMTIENAHNHTCEWILTTTKYQEWLDATRWNEHYGFLWIKGKAGSGKSTLLKHVFYNALETMQDKIILSFFFNARGTALEKSTIGTYRSLLLQLLEEFPTLQSVFDSLRILPSNIRADYQWTTEALKFLLQQTLLELKEWSVICFIDALDECNDDQIRDMISFFEEIGQHWASNRSRVRICFSSRHYPHITTRKCLEMILERQMGHDQDITHYINSKLEVGSGNLSQQVRECLQTKASGIFMWVVLVVGVLNKEYDRGRIHSLTRKLEEIPSGLHQLLHDILTHESDNKKELRSCVQWILYARRPLHPQELFVAIHLDIVQDNISEYDFSETTMESVHRFILDSSRGLAEITKSEPQTVQFIHESIRDYLLKENGLSKVWTDSMQHFEGQAHDRLAKACLRYICFDFDIIHDLSKCQAGVHGQVAEGDCRCALENITFLEYVIEEVLHHADRAACGGVSQEQLLQSFPVRRWIMLDNLCQVYEDERHTDGTGLVYILAQRHMFNLVKEHPSIALYLRMEGESLGIASFMPVAKSDGLPFQAFLRADSDIGLPGELRDKFEFSEDLGVLSYFTRFDKHAILAWLLEKDHTGYEVKDDSALKVKSKLLLWAASRGHAAVTKLLLDAGTEVNVTDEIGSTALQEAAFGGHNAVLKQLLGAGAEVNLQDVDMWTPLLSAASRGHRAILTQLLDAGAQVNIQSKEGSTPLTWAARGGYETIVQRLLEAGAEYNVQDGSGQTPLLWAAYYGHLAVVKQLLEAGAAVNLQDKTGRTALSWVLRVSEDIFVTRLLEAGAEFIFQNSVRQPLLSWASTNKPEALMKRLLEARAEVNFQDKSGSTPLLWAGRDRQEAVVKQWTEAGADVNIQGSVDRMPLSLAVKHEQEAVVKQLLEAGAEVNLQDKHGSTPLLWAVRDRQEVVVEQLIEAGADVNLQDSDGRTPLSWATGRKYTRISKLLLEAGASHGYCQRCVQETDT